MFGDSDTPYVPPVIDGSGTNSQPSPEELPPTGPATPYVTAITVIYPHQRPTSEVSAIAGQYLNFSYEGQRPNLSKLQLRLFWSDSTMTLVEGTNASIVTSPRILDQTWGGKGPLTDPWETTIKVSHITNPAVTADVIIPGVVMIDQSYNDEGFIKGVKATGSVAEFLQDDELSFTGVTLYLRYQIMTKPIASSVGNTAFPEALSVQTMSFTPDENYIFADYWNGFPNQKASTNRLYAYGVDTSLRGPSRVTNDGITWPNLPNTAGSGYNRDGTVFILVSKGYNHYGTDTSRGVMSDSLYVPVTLTAHRFIRRVELNEIKWLNTDISLTNDVTTARNFWFEEPGLGRSDVSRTNRGSITTQRLNWWNHLIDSDLSIKVYYDGLPDADYKVRGIAHLTRANRLGQAAITRVPQFYLLDEEGAEAVVVALSYYGYDVPGVGSTDSETGKYDNTVELQVPIATFKETLEFGRRTTTALPPNLKTPGGRAYFTPRRTEFYNSIGQTYRLYGLYDFNGAEQKRNVGNWDISWFDFSEILGYTESTSTVVDVEVTIRRGTWTGEHPRYEGTGTILPVEVTGVGQ